ncbi:MAG TPA: protein kinase [Vicinamibacterales bacterium]|nr:protein kinase [Vicinamibacterales bacterium]
MPMSAGTRLGPYEILAPIGAGGMGEVYKARDTRLERIVALKVLPPALAADPEFKARFEREAKSISALNHPHICTLYDVGSQNGTDFLVMEHLDGETLAARLAKGPLPADHAIEYAMQIADALDKAHRHGIVHRDLKPANVFLVKDVGAAGPGVCKLLDFGLAKLGAGPAPGTIETKLLTSPPRGNQTAPLTSQGSLLGTFQYMAPEQIEGQDADARTDIWAFGCVLYEMLTGRRAFEGRSQASLLASILERQPTPMAELQPMTPPALSRLVRTCLEKHPDNRFHTAHDLRLHLQWIAEGGSAAGLPAPVVASRKRYDRLMFGVGALVLAALAGAGAWFLKPAPVTTNVVARFAMPLGVGQAFSRTGRRVVAISPDGTKIAYIANFQIYVRHIHEIEAQPIRGTNVDPLDLTFSPDGQEIAFFVPTTPQGPPTSVTLRKIRITGGTPVTLCPAATPHGLRWQGDTLVFGQGESIAAIPETGGKARTLVSVTQESGEQIGHPQLLNDGRDVIYSVRQRGNSWNDGDVVVQPVSGGARRALITGGTDGRVLPSGYLIYWRDDALWGQAFDERALQLTGGPVQLEEGVRTSFAGTGTGVGQFSVADNGTLVFVPGANALLTLVWVDRLGKAEPIGAPPRAYRHPRISRAGGPKIAVAAFDGDIDIWIWDETRKTIIKLTSGPDWESSPIWSADSAHVYYNSDAGGQLDVYRQAADGTGVAEKLTSSPGTELPLAMMPDGKGLLVRTVRADDTKLAVLSLVDRALKPLLKTSFNQVNGDVSSDGRWILYQSVEGSTVEEVHVRPYPDTNAGHWQISTAGGQMPLWSRSGREIFYLARRPDRLMVAPVTPVAPGAPFTFGTPVALFAVPFITSAVDRTFDISPDDKRFVFARSADAEANALSALTVIVHWLDSVKARIGK